METSSVASTCDQGELVIGDSDPDQEELNAELHSSSCGFLSPFKHPLRGPLLLMTHPPILGHRWCLQLGSDFYHWPKEICELQDSLAILDVSEEAEKAKPQENK